LTLKARAEFCAPGLSPIDVHRHEGTRALDDVLAVEQRGRQLVATAGTMRAPVDDQRLVFARAWRTRQSIGFRWHRDAMRLALRADANGAEAAEASRAPGGLASRR